jgi:hypothetical protein
MTMRSVPGPFLFDTDWRRRGCGEAGLAFGEGGSMEGVGGAPVEKRKEGREKRTEDRGTAVDDGYGPCEKNHKNNED